MTAKTGALPPSQHDKPTKFQCLTCEFVVDSATLPFRCPRCGASRVKFIELGAAGAGAEGDE